MELYNIGLVLLLIAHVSSRSNLDLILQNFIYGAPENSHLSVDQIIRKNGYLVEDHHVTTSDGYILMMNRIPLSHKCRAEITKKLPILAIHGLYFSSYTYIISDESGLAYLLADNCYDVWLGNSRGTIQSRNHTYLSTNTEEYWDFSWDEMGAFDLPAFIDYILKKTQMPQLLYLGYSQGSTQFYVYASLYPDESVKRVKASFTMAPAVLMGDADCKKPEWIALNIDAEQVLERSIFLFTQIQPVEFPSILFKVLNQRKTLSPAASLMCEVPFFNSDVSEHVLRATFGRTPAGISFGQTIHFMDTIATGEFRRYNRGIKKNLELYKNIVPPKYQLENIILPVYIYYGQNDELAPASGAENLTATLQNAKKYKVNDPFFNHFDFIFSPNVKTLVYDRLLIDLDSEAINNESYCEVIHFPSRSSLNSINFGYVQLYTTVPESSR